MGNGKYKREYVAMEEKEKKGLQANRRGKKNKITLNSLYLIILIIHNQIINFMNKKIISLFPF